MKTATLPFASARIAQRPLVKTEAILVVDDNVDLLDLQRTLLEMEGFRVFTAQGGEEALNILAEIDDLDLILLDMRMEGMTGCDFMLELERRRPELIKRVPIVLLSAMNEVPKTKAAGFIRKPFEIDRFLNEVRAFIQRVPCISGLQN